MRAIPKYLVGLALFGAVAASAQPASPTPVAPAPAKKAPKLLTLGEMQARAQVIADQLKGDGQFMEHLRTIVRRDRDVIKLNCVNDKFVEQKAQVNLFDQHRAAFNGSADNVDTARPHFDEMVKIGDASATLKNDANGCVGVPELTKQESGVEVHHPDFPDDPTTAAPFNDTVVDVDPPGYASPFN